MQAYAIHPWHCVISLSNHGNTHLDGQNAWHNGALNAYGAAVPHKLYEGLCLKEKLCDDEIGACIHYLFQMLQILLVGVTVRMACWIT